jgi:hypothetical protein
MSPRLSRRICALRLRAGTRAVQRGARTNKKAREKLPGFFLKSERDAHEQPVVEPQVSHFRQVPLRTSVKFWHSGQASPT